MTWAYRKNKVQGVVNQLSNLNITKPPGPNGFSPKILENIRTSINHPNVTLFTLHFKTNKYYSKENWHISHLYVKTGVTLRIHHTKNQLHSYALYAKYWKKFFLKPCTIIWRTTNSPILNPIRIWTLGFYINKGTQLCKFKIL